MSVELDEQLPTAEPVVQIPVAKTTTRKQVRDRIEDASLTGLMADVKQNGFIQPIGAYREADRFVVLWGERRFRCAILLGLEAVPGIIRPRPANDTERLVVQLTENLQRAELNPLEAGEGFVELSRTGPMTLAAVAKRVGLSSPSVCKLATLTTLDEVIKDLLRKKFIPWSAGYDLARIEDPSARLHAANELAAKRLTRDGLSGLVKQMGTSKIKKSKPGGPRATAVLDQGRRVIVCDPEMSLDRFITTVQDVLGLARKARTKGLEIGTFLKVLRDQARS